MRIRERQYGLLLWLFVAGMPLTLSATGFTIDNTTSTTAQSLAADETGTVTSTGTLNVSNGKVAVTVTGNNATVTNLGLMEQTGTGSNAARVIRDNTGVTGLTITNGSVTNNTAKMLATDADVIQMNKANASVTLNNYGILESDNASAAGNQAVDFNAITSGSNVVNNYSTGQMLVTEADVVRPGVDGQVNNAGTMKSTTTTGSSSDGVDAQNNSGIAITNASNFDPDDPSTPGTGLIEGARHGITGGAADDTVSYTMTVTNNLGGTIQGDNGSGINIDGFNANETVTIVNHGAITGNGVTGDGDGVDVDGLVTLTNTGTITSLNAVGSTSEGITVGGGTILNSGTIEGDVLTGNTSAVGRGITLAGVDTSGTAEPIYGDSTVTNDGLIKGQSDSALVVEGAASGFTVVITNNVDGTFMGGGTTAAAIQTGADNDTINDAGVIDGSSSKKAIDMGAGNNSLHITGGSASILGDINGGAGGTNEMTIDPGAGNTFSYGGAISNFDEVDVLSGIVDFSGANTYTGTTVVSGGVLELGAADSLFSGSTLDLDGGTFDLNGFGEGSAGAAGIGTFALTQTSTLDFGDADPSIDFGALGSHALGAILNITDYVNGDHLYFTGTPDVFTSLYAPGDVCFNGVCGYVTQAFDGYFEVDPTATPTPEPATLCLFGSGLLGLAVMMRKRLS